MDPSFVADSFGKAFWGKPVLKSATLWARPGAVTVLLGRNGSGKTVLIKCALGIIRADRGVVHFTGKTFLRPRLHQLARRGLFYVPDYDLLSRRLRIGAQLDLMASRFRQPARGNWVERLGVADLLDRYPHQVSGGERRRAELAMAMVRRPACLLADEPLGEIEPKDRPTVGEALRELAAAGCAVAITGHEVEDLLRIGDEIIWMVAGTTHGLGTPEEAKGHLQFRSDYLGSRVG
jgi:lipopolysaccharide export system ATP-binding protein